MASKKKFYCVHCDFFCFSIDDYAAHLESKHSDLFPQGMNDGYQYAYYLKTKRTHGSCVICKKPTNWNSKTHKYHRFCKNPKCKEKYIEVFRNRMIGKYGKTTLLNDPEQQKKMLANRSISGVYIWRDRVTETRYTGSYEKSFLEFLDKILEFDPTDIIAPSPHIYWYEYEGKKHFYIPDFFIPSLNLEIEIKDGGDNPNNHQKIQAVDKVKEKLKDEVMMKNHFNYIKIVNKNNSKFFEFLSKNKEQMLDPEKKSSNIVMIESADDMFDVDDVFEEVHWDTLLTRPQVFFNKSIKLYHYSNSKKDTIIPITVNAGNKLAKPRFSSWWTPQKSQSGWVLSYILFSKFKDCKWEDVLWDVEEFNTDGLKYKAPKTIISQSFFNKHKDFIKSVDIYEHEKTFKGKDLGRGCEYSVDEFTCDFAVKPDKVRRIPFDELINMIKIVPDEEMKVYKKKLNDMRLHNKNWQDIVHTKKPWLYWEFDVGNDIRVKYCKDHGIDFKVDEEYFRFTYQGIDIYEALREKVSPEVWKKLVSSSNFTWLPKPQYHSKTCLSYFTKEGRELFTKKVLPICEKYLGEEIEFCKVKNLKNIVYKDKYQVITDTNIDDIFEEACKSPKEARELSQKVRELAKEYDANFYFVTDGASTTSNNGNPAVKVARDAVAKWERKNGFDDKEDWTDNPDDFSNYKLKQESIDNDGISFSDIKDIVDTLGEDENVTTESLETFLTTNPFESNITVYHGSPEKINIIKPLRINVGTKISKPRMSSFWGSDYKWCKVFAIQRLIQSNKFRVPNNLILRYMDSSSPYTEDLICLIDDKDKIEKLLKSSKIYIYEKTFDKKYVGIGHNACYPEISCDFPVKPDKCDVLSYNDFKDVTIKYISEDEFNDYWESYAKPLIDKDKKYGKGKLLKYSDNQRKRISKHIKNI